MESTEKFLSFQSKKENIEKWMNIPSLSCYDFHERETHQVGVKKLSLFPTHVSWLFVDWFTLMVGLKSLNWTS